MIYLTGSGGFLGSHLRRVLIGDVITIPHEQIADYDYAPFDKFFFLSTFGNMIEHDDDEKIMQANVIDVIKMMEKVIKFNFKSFVFISTSSVKLPRQTMYSRAKDAAEQILLAFKEKYNAPICIVRPTTIYGPHEQPQHLIPTILRSCFKGELMNFVPEPVHDWIYVEDIVDGILNLSEHSAKGIYELGTGIKTINQEILNLIEEITGKKANINFVPSMRDYDTQDWVATNFKARSFGWLPKVSLKEGLKRVVEDYVNKKYE